MMIVVVIIMDQVAVEVVMMLVMNVFVTILLPTPGKGLFFYVSVAKVYTIGGSKKPLPVPIECQMPHVKMLFGPK